MREAQLRIEKLRPAAIICNQCQHEITTVEHVPVKGEGINAVFSGTCPECKATTFAVHGDSEAVQRIMEMMASYSPDSLLFGVQ